MQPIKVTKFSLKGSPFIGVFCRTTEKVSLVPHGLQPREKKTIENILQTEIVACSLANSSLIGVLCIGNSHGFVVPEIVENQELKALHEIGISVKRIEGVQALGNLVAVNDSNGLCTPLLTKPAFETIQQALRIKLHAQKMADSDLVGSALVLSNRGFVCTPHADKNEIGKIEQATALKGNPSTANFGDVFVGNSVVANSNGALAGLQSTPHEMLAIEEAFSGEA